LLELVTSNYLSFTTNLLTFLFPEVSIGSPQDIKHNIHVTKELDWHIKDPETSFKLEEKLGEG
jgi:hypothetical protein